MGLAHSSSIVRSGLVLHLDAANIKSYPGAGTTWTNLSSTGNHLIISGPDYVSSNPAHFSFLGSQVDQIYINTATIFNNITTATVSLWARLDTNLVDHSLVSYAVSGSTNEYLMYYSAPNNRIDIWFDGTSLSFNYQLPLNSWFNLVNVVTTNTNEVFVNSQLVGSTTKTGTNLNNGGYLVLGQEQDSVGGTFDVGQDLEGDIGIVMIYEKNLSSTEIRQNFEAYRDRFRI